MSYDMTPPGVHHATRRYNHPPPTFGTCWPIVTKSTAPLPRAVWGTRPALSRHYTTLHQTNGIIALLELRVRWCEAPSGSSEICHESLLPARGGQGFDTPTPCAELKRKHQRWVGLCPAHAQRVILGQVSSTLVPS